MDTMTRLTKMQDEMFDLMKRVEQPMVRGTGEMAERVARYTPTRPPFMHTMPTMAEMVDQGLLMRKRMVDEQAKFVRQMMKAMGPVFTKFDAMPKHEHKAEHQPAARPAPRRVVHKAA
jgi:hypothetical protein